MSESIPPTTLEPISIMGSSYTDEQRKEAVMHYLVKGSVTEVSNALCIPRSTLQDWKKTEWWYDLSVALRQEQNDQLEAGMTRIIEKTLTQLEDRVDHGEATGKIDTDGNPVKLPMRGRDLAVAGAIIFDKRLLLRSHPTGISSGTGLSDLAIKLVQAFQSVVQRNEKTIEGKAERVTGGDNPGS
jgi:hypothetical protein